MPETPAMSLAQDFNERYMAAWNSGDLEALGALYHPDAMLASVSTTEGRSAIVAALNALMQAGWTTIEIVAQSARHVGDTVVFVNDYTAQDENGKRLDARSTQAMVFEDGEWRTIMHTAI